MWTAGGLEGGRCADSLSSPRAILEQLRTSAKALQRLARPGGPGAVEQYRSCSTVNLGLVRALIELGADPTVRDPDVACYLAVLEQQSS
jgi:hypothetical protein